MRSAQFRSLFDGVIVEKPTPTPAERDYQTGTGAQ